MRFVITLAAAAACALAPPAAAAQPGPAAQVAEADARQRVSAVFDRLKAKGYSGAAAVTLKGRPVFAGASGEAAPGRPWRVEMASDIFSIAKTVIAIAIMKTVEDGKVSLSDPLSKWFPDTPADKAAITVQQLLTHSAGLVDTPEGIDEDYTRVGADEYRRKVLAEPLTYPPGTGRRYCNSCFSILAMIVEKASGRSFHDYLRDEVLRPAGVKASYDPMAFPVGMVSSGKRDDTLKWNDIQSEGDASKGPFWFLWGAGGLYASMPDLARLADAFMAGRIVSRRSVALMLADYGPDGPGSSQGLGWVVVKTKRGTSYAWHNGGGVYGGSALRHYPEIGLTVATVSNSRAPSSYRMAREIAEALLGPDDDAPVVSREGALPADAPESRLYADFVRAAYGSREDQLAFMRARFTPAFMGDAARQERLLFFFTTSAATTRLRPNR